jgi:hypothetical protein
VSSPLQPAASLPPSTQVLPSSLWPAASSSVSVCKCV